MLTVSPFSLKRLSMDLRRSRTKPLFRWSEEEATQFSSVENVARSSSVAKALWNCFQVKVA